MTLCATQDQYAINSLNQIIWIKTYMPYMQIIIPVKFPQLYLFNICAYYSYG